jgi:carbamoylphosphate synthase small subunit
VPDEKAVDEFGILRWVESAKIYASALIVSAYTEEYSHWNAVESLSSWLKRHNVPGLYGEFDIDELIRWHDDRS